MLDLWNVVNDVMSTDPWFRTFSVPSGAQHASLAVDVAENEAAYLITAELPGVPLENVNIEIEDDVLTLSAVKRPAHSEQEQQQRGFQYSERRYGTFTRTFTLPKAIDRDGVQATMKDGILTISLPKAAQARPRQIPVRLAQGEPPARQMTAEASESSHGQNA